MESDQSMDSCDQASCPDEEMLMNYLKGLLLKDECAQLEEHILNCDRCLDTVVMTKNMMQDKGEFGLEPVPESVTKKAVSMVSERIKIWPESYMINLKRSVRHIGARMFDYFRIKPWSGFELARVRGVRGSKITASEDFILLKVLFSKMITRIEIEKLKNETAHIRVQAATPIEKQARLRVTLKREQREIASYLLNDDVIFENMPFDHYNITLFLDGENLGTYYFKIKGTHHGNR